MKYRKQNKTCIKTSITHTIESQCSLNSIYLQTQTDRLIYSFSNWIYSLRNTDFARQFHYWNFINFFGSARQLCQLFFSPIFGFCRQQTNLVSVCGQWKFVNLFYNRIIERKIFQQWLNLQDSFFIKLSHPIQDYSIDREMRANQSLNIIWTRNLVKYITTNYLLLL